MPSATMLGVAVDGTNYHPVHSIFEFAQHGA